MAEQPQQTDIVAEFVKNLVPKELLETAQLLVILNYPISDRKSLVLQLEAKKAQDPQGEKGFAALARPLPELMESVVDPFRPEDFGLDSPDNALEKFFDRTGQDPRVPLDPVATLPDTPAGLPEPPIFAEPFFGFGPCADAAAQLWREHLDSRIARLVGPNPAYYRSLQELANRCQRGWRPHFPSDLGCARQGNAAYFRCLMQGRPASRCMEDGRRAYDSCSERFRRLPVGVGPFPERGSDFV